MDRLLNRSFLVLSLFLWIVAGCSPTLTPIAQPTLFPTNTPLTNKLSISTDPRLELMAVLLSLFDYQAQDQRLMAAVNFDYKIEVKKTFGPFRNHRAVQILQRITPNRSTPPNFNHNAPVQLMLDLSNPPELVPQLPFNQELLDRAGGQKTLDDLLSAMRDFAQQTHFVDFYNRHHDFYQFISAQAMAQFSAKDLDALEAYYGVHPSSYHIILVPLFGQGSFGPSLTRPDGTTEIYFIRGTQALTFQNQPLLADPATYRQMLWHEFSHSIADPLMVGHTNEVMAYQSLFNPIASQMKHLSYGEWTAVVKEHIIRAVVIRLVFQVEGPSAAQKLLDEEKGRGFRYLDVLSRKLERYEQSRGQYSTFGSYYSELITAFADVK